MADQTIGESSDVPTMRTHALRHQPAKTHELRPGRVYLAVGPNCWGKGFTPEDAEKAARANYYPGSTGKAAAMPFIMFDAPPDVRVDEMGYTVYTPALYTVSEQHHAQGDPAGEIKYIGARPKEIYRFKPADNRNRCAYRGDGGRCTREAGHVGTHTTARS